jgi:hypothetical protein
MHRGAGNEEEDEDEDFLAGLASVISRFGGSLRRGDPRAPGSPEALPVHPRAGQISGPSPFVAGRGGPAATSSHPPASSSGGLAALAPWATAEGDILAATSGGDVRSAGGGEDDREGPPDPRRARIGGFTAWAVLQALVYTQGPGGGEAEGDLDEEMVLQVSKWQR